MTAWPQASALASDGGVTIRRVANGDAADDGAVKVTLFQASNGGLYGWYIGPVASRGGRLTIPYLPKSAKTMASVAVVRAVRAAERIGVPVCLIDPDDLWALVWRS